MARVLFLEKPGCRNNTRQKGLLEAAGHKVVARDLRDEPWTPDTLRPFFGDRPVADWFNKASPRVKSGEIDPAAVTEEQALALMCGDPLLIRRPLVQVGTRRTCGFDMAEMDAWIGLAGAPPADVETCPRSHAAVGCGTPEPLLKLL